MPVNPKILGFRLDITLAPSPKDFSKSVTALVGLSVGNSQRPEKSQVIAIPGVAQPL